MKTIVSLSSPGQVYHTFYQLFSNFVMANWQIERFADES